MKQPRDKTEPKNMSVDDTYDITASSSSSESPEQRGRYWRCHCLDKAWQVPFTWGRELKQRREGQESEIRGNSYVSLPIT